MLDIILEKLKKIFSSRLIYLILLTTVLFVILIVRIYNIQVLDTSADPESGSNVVTTSSYKTNQYRFTDSTRGRIFDKNGNIYKKWRGEVSTTVGKTMFITEGYNEELYDVELVAVVDTETFEEIVGRPYTFVPLEDNRWFLENNMSAFLEAYNTERDDMIDESDVDTDEWFCYQPTVEYYSERKYIAINLATHEQAEFKV